jgi:hypothetical protein
MQSKSVHYLFVGIVLCLLSIAPSIADPNQNGRNYQWDNWNIYTVQNGPPAEDTTFTVDKIVTVTYLDSYHWNDGQGVDAPGTIRLKSDEGTVFGPYRMKGSDGQGGVPNAWWSLSFDAGKLVLYPGTYTVIDSDPDTWSSNSGSNGAGFFGIEWETSNSENSPSNRDTIVGTWDWFTDETKYFHSDGTFECWINGKKTVVGRWDLLDSPKRVYKLNQNNGEWIDTLTLSADGKNLKGHNQNNDSVSGSKISNSDY